MGHVPRKAPFALAVRKGTAGLGLYTKEEIPKGKFIIEYFGEIISDAEATRVGGKYLFDLGNGKNVSGKSRANIARYINHACKPNCVVEIKRNRIYISAKKRIRIGEELTYDYGKEYTDYYIKPHGCRCRACKK